MIELYRRPPGAWQARGSKSGRVIPVTHASRRVLEVARGEPPPRLLADVKSGLFSRLLYFTHGILMGVRELVGPGSVYCDWMR